MSTLGERVADMFDFCADTDGQWGAATLDEIASILLSVGVMTYDHGCGHLFATAKGECPFHSEGDRGPTV